MKSFALVLTGIFSFIIIDLRLFRGRTKNFVSQDVASFELSDRKENLKRKQRKYQNKKYKKHQSFKQKVLKWKGTQSKSTRHSNQRALRRMYRNC